MSSLVRQPRHAVQFYGEDQQLFETVRAFLGQGFLEGQPALVVARPQQAAGILGHLQHNLIDVARAQRLGYLQVVDAISVIERAFDGKILDPRKLQAIFGPVVDVATRGRERRTVRVYGELSDLLIRQGRSEAAFQLEALSNHQGANDTILLCGYQMQTFTDERGPFEHICGLHEQVMLPRSSGVEPSDSPRAD